MGDVAKNTKNKKGISGKKSMKPFASISNMAPQHKLWTVAWSLSCLSGSRSKSSKGFSSPQIQVLASEFGSGIQAVFMRFGWDLWWRLWWSMTYGTVDTSLQNLQAKYHSSPPADGCDLPAFNKNYIEWAWIACQLTPSSWPEFQIVFNNVEEMDVSESFQFH